MRVVSQDVSAIERQVEEAEDEMGSLSGIKRVFRSLSIPPFLSVSVVTITAVLLPNTDQACRISQRRMRKFIILVIYIPKTA